METIMNILMITPFFPYPAEFGGTIRTYHLARELAKSNDLFLLSFKDREDIEPAKVKKFSKHVEIIPFSEDSKRIVQLKTHNFVLTPLFPCYHFAFMGAPIILKTAKTNAKINSRINYFVVDNTKIVYVKKFHCLNS